jgi:glycosyltransferase involved in cell wall biosynthesis
MRVLKTVQSYFPFQDRGGPVVKVRALARGLAQRGHQVTVLTADLGFGKQNRTSLKMESSRWGWRAEENGVEAIYLPTLGHYRALTINPRVIGFCRASLRQFDLVHFYGLYDLLGPAVSHFCRREGIAYVIEPMGMYLPIVRSIHLKEMYRRLLGRGLVSGARFLIATSEQEKQELLAAGTDASKVVTRRNGIEVPEKIPARGEFRRQRDIPNEAKLILFLGRLVSKKSPDLLLKAFAQWRHKTGRGQSAVLVLAGPEERDGFLPALKEMANQLELKGCVLFVGPLYDEAKWSAYRDADVFVLPSQNENFGNTAAEAAVCGTPVIVTDRCGVASFIGPAGLVIRHDEGELAIALARLLDDPALRQRCQEGCDELGRRLSWDDPLDQTEALYAECISGSTRQ